MLLAYNAIDSLPSLPLRWAAAGVKAGVQIAASILGTSFIKTVTFVALETLWWSIERHRTTHLVEALSNLTHTTMLVITAMVVLRLCIAIFQQLATYKGLRQEWQQFCSKALIQLQSISLLSLSRGYWISFIQEVYLNSFFQLIGHSLKITSKQESYTKFKPWKRVNVKILADATVFFLIMIVLKNLRWEPTTQFIALYCAMPGLMRVGSSLIEEIHEFD